MCLRHGFIFFILTILAGCNTQNIQPASGNLSDYIEVQKRADDAYQNEDWVTAEKEYSFLAKNIPGEMEPWFRLGNIYARTEQFDAAVSAYREALVRDQNNSKIWHNLGVVQLRQATNTFIEMLEYTDTSDPLNQRARYVINSVSELLTTGFNASNTN